MRPPHLKQVSNCMSCKHSEWEEGIDDEYLECKKHDFVFEEDGGGDEAERLVCEDWEASAVRGEDSIGIVLEEPSADPIDGNAVIEMTCEVKPPSEPPFKIEKIVIDNDRIKGIVVNRMPNLVYERDGEYLVGKDGPFCNIYRYDKPAIGWQAFAGHKFDIHMKDGSVEKAYGQWWFAGYLPGHMSIGADTEEGLRKCYVFSAVGVDATFVNAAIEAGVEQVDYRELEKTYRRS